MDNTSDDDQKHQHLRYFGEMRFKQLTLLMGFMSVSFAGIVAIGEKPFIPGIDGIDLRLLISIVGLLFTSMLWIMEVRSTVVWSEVKSSTTVNWPFYKYFFPLFINATSVVLGFYMAIYLLWAYFIHVLKSNLFLDIASICVFAILTVISIVNYCYCIIIARETKKECEPRH